MSPRPEIVGLEELRLGIKSRGIFACLDRARPKYVSMPQLVAALYSAEPNGGPASAERSIAVLVCKLRRKLGKIGWTVSEGRMGGGEPGRYRLEPVEGK